MVLPFEQLNRFSLAEFPVVFSSLEAPQAEDLCGLYRGYFVGPTWLRRLADPLLVITGMGHWLGKDFDPQGRVVNLVRTRAGIVRKLPMRNLEQDSLIDGRLGLALRYEASNPFPWPHVLDELRSLQEGFVLGMTIIQLGPLTRLPLPFLLQPVESMRAF